MKQSKTILFITGKIIYGGAGKMMSYVAGLCAKEYECVYAIAIDEEAVCNEQNGVIYLPSLNVHKSGLKNWVKTVVTIRRKVKELKPDVVVAFVSDVAVACRLATLLCMQKVIFVSAERSDPFAQNQIWKKLTNWAYRNSDYCFFQLERARNFYSESVIQKSFVIPNAAFFYGERGCHYAKNKTIVTIGRFVQQKGFSYLLDAFDIIHKKHPEYRLIIYGDGVLRDDYEKQIANLGLEGLVSFPGYTHNVSEALRCEGIFAMPSLYEGIPNALIEAMLIGIPTVSTNCTPGGPDFLTNHGTRGLLVPVRDSVALASAICQLIEDKKLYAYLEKEGPHIEKILDPKIIEKQWIDAFHIITGNTNIQKK